MLINNNKQGFSLVEVIIALGVFAVLAAGVIRVSTSSYSSFYGAGDKQAITEFAQEGIEITKAIRDNSWQDLEDVSGTGEQGVGKVAAGYWTFSGNDNILGDLTRTIVVTDVQRDNNEEIVISGGIDDPHTKKVVVTVIGSGIDNYVLNTYLTNWSYESWLQTDWQGIGSREFWANSTMASSSYSNINTSTPGEITLSGSYDHSGSLYSSIYDLGSNDPEFQSIAVEQNVPSGCDLDVTLEVSNNRTFAVADVVSSLFSSNNLTNYVSSTPTSLSGKRFVRYKLEMTACNSDTETPTFYSLKVNYR